jgi:hypothetical protein
MRVVITVIATVLVVAGEFALLTAIYDRGQPTREQRVVVASLAGEWKAATAPATATAIDDAANAITRLRRLGLGAGSTGQLSSAVADLRTDDDAASTTKRS